MATPQVPSNTLLTKHVVNGFRYQLAVTSKGREVLNQVYDWLYQGGPSIKDYFLQLGYSGAYYKKVLNSSQRKLIDSGATSDSFDISLLYALVSHVCGLAEPTDPVWTSPGGSPSLENLLRAVKQERNLLAHTNDASSLSDRELELKLAELKDIFSEILKVAGGRASINPDDIDDLVEDIDEYFRVLSTKVREPLNASELSLLPQLQEEIQVFQDTLHKKVEEESRQELLDFYAHMRDVPLAQWLYPDLSIRLASNFTNLVIEEDMSHAAPSQQPQEPSGVAVEELLQTTRRDGQLPEVLIISGEGGIGKTTMLKFIVEKWATDPSKINGLQDFSPLLFFQLRGSNITRWKDFLKNLLRDTFMNSGVTDEYFADILLNLRTLVLLDGYDEANRESKALITDLLNLQGNIRLLITTRPSSVTELTQKVFTKKRGMNIKVKGIRTEDRSAFLQKTLDVLVQEPFRRDDILHRVIAHLDALNSSSENLEVPLTMTLLALREIEAPDDSGTGNVYEDLTLLMQKKVEERLVLKDIDNAEAKVIEYHEFQKKIALRAYKRNEYDLMQETVKELKAKCTELDIPHAEMLSGFLSSKKGRQGLFVIDIWSFPHNRFQEHWAASHIITDLITLSSSLPDLEILLDTPGPEEQDKDASYASVMSRENPVLRLYLEDPEQMKQMVSEKRNLELAVIYKVQNKECQLILDIVCYVTQLLALSKKQLLVRYAPAIVSLVLYMGCNQQRNVVFCHELCRCIEASGYSEDVLESSAKALHGRRVYVTREKFLGGLVALVQKTGPTLIALFLDFPTQSREELKALEDLSQEEVEISLHFLRSYISTHYYLQSLMKSKSTAILTYFKGSVNGPALSFLPASLKELHIEITGTHLRILAGRLPTMNSLQVLDILLVDHPAPVSLSALPYMGKVLSLCFKGNIQAIDVNWLCDVVQKLCSSYRRGRDNRIMSHWWPNDVSEKFAQGLKQRGIVAIKKTWTEEEFPHLNGRRKVVAGYSLW